MFQVSTIDNYRITIKENHMKNKTSELCTTKIQDVAGFDSQSFKFLYKSKQSFWSKLYRQKKKKNLHIMIKPIHFSFHLSKTMFSN